MRCALFSCAPLAIRAGRVGYPRWPRTTETRVGPPPLYRASFDAGSRGVTLYTSEITIKSSLLRLLLSFLDSRRRISRWKFVCSVEQGNKGVLQADVGVSNLSQLRVTSGRSAGGKAGKLKTHCRSRRRIERQRNRATDLFRQRIDEMMSDRSGVWRMQRKPSWP